MIFSLSVSVTNVILAHDIGATPEYVASWVVVYPVACPHVVRGLTPVQASACCVRSPEIDQMPSVLAEPVQGLPGAA